MSRNVPPTTMHTVGTGGDPGATMARISVLVAVFAVAFGGAGGGPAAPAGTGAPRGLTELIQPAQGEGPLVEWAFAGARLVHGGGNEVSLRPMPNASYFAGVAPAVTASASGRFVAYSTGVDAAHLQVRVRDLWTGRERALGRATTSAAWRADSALVYFRGRMGASRLRGHLFVRGDGGRGPAVRWTATAGRYVAFGWAGGRLVLLRISEGEYVETLVADSPGVLRELADGTPVAISPDGTRLLAFAGGDGSGRDLVLVDLRTGRVVSRLRVRVHGTGDWKRDLVAAAAGREIVLLRVRGDRIALVRRIRVPGRSVSEPRFIDTSLRRVVARTGRPDGVDVGLAVCALATGRCAFGPSRHGPGGQGVVYGQGVASPTLPAPPDGRHFGFIRSLEPGAGAPTMVFDRAAWLTGKAAQRAALADHQEVSNDYYIRNEDRSTSALPVAPDAKITVVAPDAIAGRPSSLAALLATFRGPRPGGTFHQGPGAEYWITVRDATVVAIAEQYTP